MPQTTDFSPRDVVPVGRKNSMKLPENPTNQDIAHLALVAAAKEATTVTELLQVAQVAKDFASPRGM